MTNDNTRTIIHQLPDERWWGGRVTDGRFMPYGTTDFRCDLATWQHQPGQLPEASNQSAPLLVSTKGRYIWDDAPFEFAIGQNSITIRSDHAVKVRQTPGGTLRDAYLEACHQHFPPSGNTPALEMFAKPQYNTWIEMPYHPTQQGVLEYADSMLAAGMPAGVLMIDDKWSPDYGNWTFDPATFPNPQSMIDRLHARGFNVIVWLVPFVSPDSAVFRELEDMGLMLRDKHGRTAIRRWWNGLSAVLDLSNPATCAWVRDRLDALRALGVDGFKFDGGDLYDFHPDDRSHRPMTSNDMCEQWARIGAGYPFNEFRACWKMGGQPLAQRLQDKPAAWDETGIGSLIPEMLAQGMIGHAFVCPDMIGGGEVNSARHSGVDQEFFVRYAQIAALAPMMQFSVAPSRVLDEAHLAAVRHALEIRERYLPTILGLAEHAARTGEPIIRPMSYHFPDMETITDQFMLGSDIIVAPCTERGAKYRRVAIPAGLWHSDDGQTIEGPTVVETPCPLGRLPRFTRQD
ncbi:glycoside hydrolase family 31 protein [Bifidobacterium aerophilum]|uniref:Glycosyl hydrolase family 31 n=1 Tax=Bifidobacterium aerophilum TaxID=1798155 RepID=A0A6N9Z502_9BIFI|nr:glycoside hydrolase family 31 protein [Bifidobacterium aerophilum]NEG89789.1 glycosyl hydrolase family 31 [Bifidobacterium aerophilum]